MSNYTLVSPYKTCETISRVARRVVYDGYRADRSEGERLTQTAVAERLGVSQPAVQQALDEQHDESLRYVRLRLRILSEIGGFLVNSEPRYYVARP